jgi:hypothetical protein
MSQKKLLILEKRIEIYPEIIKITQEIGKEKTSKDLHLQALEDLKEWQSKYGGTLFMTDISYKNFQNLKTSLNTIKKLKPEQNLDKAKIDSIWNLRCELRTSLREEIHNKDLYI